jgi:hypothetical protein
LHLTFNIYCLFFCFHKKENCIDNNQTILNKQYIKNKNLDHKLCLKKLSSTFPSNLSLLYCQNVVAFFFFFLLLLVVINGKEKHNYNILYKVFLWVSFFLVTPFVEWEKATEDDLKEEKKYIEDNIIIHNFHL